MSLIVVSTSDLPPGWTPKPTYDEVAAALRAIVEYGSSYLLDDEHLCYFCCENLSEDSRLRETGPIVHAEGCIYAAAKALLERLDVR